MPCKALKKGFLRRGVKGQFLRGEIKKYGNREGIAREVIKKK